MGKGIKERQEPPGLGLASGLSPRYLTGAHVLPGGEVCSQSSSLLTPNSLVAAEVMTVPIWPKRMLRPREGEEPTQGHTAHSGKADGGRGLKPRPEIFP